MMEEEGNPTMFLFFSFKNKYYIIEFPLKVLAALTRKKIGHTPVLIQ